MGRGRWDHCNQMYRGCPILITEGVLGPLQSNVHAGGCSILIIMGRVLGPLQSIVQGLSNLNYIYRG